VPLPVVLMVLLLRRLPVLLGRRFAIGSQVFWRVPVVPLVAAVVVLVVPELRADLKANCFQVVLPALVPLAHLAQVPELRADLSEFLGQVAPQADLEANCVQEVLPEHPAQGLSQQSWCAWPATSHHSPAGSTEGTCA
jgi:hypothetical protein